MTHDDARNRFVDGREEDTIGGDIEALGFAVLVAVIRIGNSVFPDYGVVGSVHPTTDIHIAAVHFDLIGFGRVVRVGERPQNKRIHIDFDHII